MNIFKLTKNNRQNAINQAVEVLKHGGLIIYPTETCYGAGVNALNGRAVLKLLEYKKRPEGKAVSIAVNDKRMALKYVEINKEAENIYDKFLPGPITVISKSKGNAVKLLEAENRTLGIRLPGLEIVRKIIDKAGFPITSTSANSTGKKTPYSVLDVLKNISKKQKNLIDLIIDAGELPHNPPSTVIDTTRDKMKILRQGNFIAGKKHISIKVSAEEDMEETARKWISGKSSILKTGALLVLFNAELGAGKTRFVKGIAKGLGIKETVKSPTYTFIEEYSCPTGFFLVHVDAWRLEDLDDLKKLYLEKYLKPGNVVAVEWSGAVSDYLFRLGTESKSRVASIYIDYLNEKERLVRIYE